MHFLFFCKFTAEGGASLENDLDKIAAQTAS